MSHRAAKAEDHTAIERALWEGYDRHPADPADDHEDHRRFWESLAQDLDDHSTNMEKHSRKAKRLAEVVRTVITTKKFAGRSVPNSTHYAQTVTRKSDAPFKKT